MVLARAHTHTNQIMPILSFNILSYFRNKMLSPDLTGTFPFKVQTIYSMSIYYVISPLIQIAHTYSLTSHRELDDVLTYFSIKNLINFNIHWNSSSGKFNMSHSNNSWVNLHQYSHKDMKSWKKCNLWILLSV